MKSKYILIYEVNSYPEEGGGTYVEERESLAEIKTFIEDEILCHDSDVISIYSIDEEYKVKPKEIIKTINLYIVED